MTKKKSSPKSKIKAKPLARLPKKLGDDAYAYTAAIVEDLKSDFRVVAENQKALVKKAESHSAELGRINENITELKIGQSLMRDDIAVMKQDISELKDRVTSVETDIKEIKQELKFIKSEMIEFRTLLSQKADIERFKRLEERVARIEQTLSLRQ